MSEDSQVEDSQVDDTLTPEQIERWEKRTFAKLRKEMRPDLDAVLGNPDGLARLLAISDEEWQAALDAEGGEVDATQP